MINLEFNSFTSDTKDIKLSAIFTADNFVYSTFDRDHQMLSYHNALPYSQFSEVLEKENPSLVKVAVKTPFFGHFGELERIPLDDHLIIDKLTGVNVWCAYESPFTPAQSAVKHFSTLINHDFYLTKKDVLLIHFDEKVLHFYVQINGEILLYNSYQLEAESDLLYYHSLIVQNLKLNAQELPLVLSGMIEHNSKAYTQLAPFHNIITYAKVPNISLKTDRFDLKPYHFYDHIINIQCGL